MAATPYGAVNDPVHPAPETATQLPELATLVFDLDGYVTHWSTAAEYLFGYPAEQVLGQHISVLLPPGGARSRIDTTIAAVAEGRVWTGAHAVKCADGHVHEINFRCEPLRGAGSRTSVMATVSRTALVRPFTNSSDTAAAAARSPLLAELITRIGSTLELGETAHEAVSVAVPYFADAASIYVLEHLVEGDERPDGARDGSIVARRLAVNVSEDETQAWAAAFPDDEVVVYSPGTPYAQCVADAKPILLRALDEDTVERIQDRAAEHSIDSPPLEGASLLLVPLQARGIVLGFMTFGRTPERDASEQPDIVLAQEIAARTAICIDNARLYTQARRTALALRNSLLPTNLVGPPGLDIAHRYLPASGMSQVGGDWYDMIRLPGGRVALVVGDAMGHDTSAAAAMVQLRTAARTLADLDLMPTDVLFRLDRIAQSLSAAQFATCLYATCDPNTRSLAIACAGHIPPVLIHADGATEQLDLPPGLPLGLGSGDYVTIELELPAECSLALFTDGLVESREQDIDTGVVALRDALRDALARAEPRRDLEEVCDTVFQRLCGQRGSDDITLLLTRLLPLGAP